jgi:hypothetical protein
MTKEEFLSEMTWFLEYYDKKLNDIQTKIWFEAFSNYSKEVFANSLKNHIKTSEVPFMPSLGNIYNPIKQRKLQ